MIGRLEKTVFDCPDPRALAEFYCAVLGMRINEDSGDWIVIGTEPGRRELAFQRAEAFAPPEYHNPERPQQLHVDIRVADIERAEPAVLKLGATRLEGRRETGFRVYADPAGHPFCLVFGGPKPAPTDPTQAGTDPAQAGTDPAQAGTDPAQAGAGATTTQEDL